jgi:hypothetical protein
MFRFVLVLAVLSAAAPATAEDWRLIQVNGSAPQRAAGLIDYDSLDLSDPNFPRIKQALLFETARPRDITASVTTHVIDCVGMRLKLVHVEGLNSEGKIVVSQAVERPYEPIEAGAPSDTIHLAVCDDTWLLTTPTDKMPLTAIARSLFGG